MLKFREGHFEQFSVVELVEAARGVGYCLKLLERQQSGCGRRHRECSCLIVHADLCTQARYELIAARNSPLLRVFDSLSISNSMLSTGESGFKTLRKTQTRFSSSRGSSNSSLRVPERLISMAGNTRLSISFRSRWISMLPVPLNSSKITSSMRLPVSMSAEATIVSEPPSSMLRAAPKKRFGRWRALESTPPESTLPEGGTTVL